MRGPRLRARKRLRRNLRRFKRLRSPKASKRLRSPRASKRRRLRRSLRFSSTLRPVLVSLALSSQKMDGHLRVLRARVES